MTNITAMGSWIGASKLWILLNFSAMDICSSIGLEVNHKTTGLVWFESSQDCNQNHWTRSTSPERNSNTVTLLISWKCNFHFINPWTINALLKKGAMSPAQAICNFHRQIKLFSPLSQQYFGELANIYIFLK